MLLGLLPDNYIWYWPWLAIPMVGYVVAIVATVRPTTRNFGQGMLLGLTLLLLVGFVLLVNLIPDYGATPSAVRAGGTADGEATVTHGCFPQKCMDSGTAGTRRKFSGTLREGISGMSVRRVLAAAVGAALVLTPLTALGSDAQPGLVKQNAADYTPQLVPTTAVPRPSVDGIASGPITTYAGGHFDRVTGTSGAVTNIVAFDTNTGAIKTAFGPTLNNVVRDVAYAPDTGGVYVGGDFTTVNGVSASTLVKLNPNGTVAWKAPWTRGIVQDVDLVSVGGAPHLIVAGSFTKKLVSLNPSTGKDDGLINQSITGEACLSDGTCSWGSTAVYEVAVANGHLVAVGNFAAPRAKFFMLDYNGNAFVLSNWYYNSFAKPCITTATRRIANLQGVDWSPRRAVLQRRGHGPDPQEQVRDLARETAD